MEGLSLLEKRYLELLRLKTRLIARVDELEWFILHAGLDVPPEGESAIVSASTSASTSHKRAKHQSDPSVPSAKRTEGSVPPQRTTGSADGASMRSSANEGVPGSNAPPVQPETSRRGSKGLHVSPSLIEAEVRRRVEAELVRSQLQVAATALPSARLQNPSYVHSDGLHSSNVSLSRPLGWPEPDHASRIISGSRGSDMRASAPSPSPKLPEASTPFRGDASDCSSGRAEAQKMERSSTPDRQLEFRERYATFQSTFPASAPRVPEPRPRSQGLKDPYPLPPNWQPEHASPARLAPSKHPRRTVTSPVPRMSNVSLPPPLKQGPVRAPSKQPHARRSEPRASASTDSARTAETGSSQGSRPDVAHPSRMSVPEPQLPRGDSLIDPMREFPPQAAANSGSAFEPEPRDLVRDGVRSTGPNVTADAAAGFSDEQERIARSERDAVEHSARENRHQREQLERAAQEPADLDSEGIERDNIDRDTAERQHVEHLRAENELVERERAAREHAEHQRAEERAEREQAEREQAERQRVEREHAERVQAERGREREQAEREQAEREQAEREQVERVRAEREQAEREQAERVRAEREQAELRQAERERAEREDAERQHAEREHAEREKAARDAEREQAVLAERQRSERARAEKQARELETRERELEERQRIERQRREYERAAREQQEKRAREEQERAEREKRERQRAAQDERERLDRQREPDPSTRGYPERGGHVASDGGRPLEPLGPAQQAEAIPIPTDRSSALGFRIVPDDDGFPVDRASPASMHDDRLDGDATRIVHDRQQNQHHRHAEPDGSRDLNDSPGVHQEPVRSLHEIREPVHSTPNHSTNAPPSSDSGNKHTEPPITGPSSSPPLELNGEPTTPAAQAALSAQEETPAVLEEQISLAVHTLPATTPARQPASAARSATPAPRVLHTPQHPVPIRPAPAPAPRAESQPPPGSQSRLFPSTIGRRTTAHPAVVVEPTESVRTVRRSVSPPRKTVAAAVRDSIASAPVSNAPQLVSPRRRAAPMESRMNKIQRQPVILPAAHSATPLSSETDVVDPRPPLLAARSVQPGPVLRNTPSRLSRVAPAAPAHAATPPPPPVQPLPVQPQQSKPAQYPRRKHVPGYAFLQDPDGSDFVREKRNL